MKIKKTTKGNTVSYHITEPSEKLLNWLREMSKRKEERRLKLIEELKQYRKDKIKE